MGKVNTYDRLKAIEENNVNVKPVVINLSDTGSNTRVLVWDPIADVFRFSSSWHKELVPYVMEGKRPTKRTALRVIMSLFDPLGLLAPILIHGRMKMQDWWRVGIDWDAEMSEPEFLKWQKWVGLLPAVER